MTPKHQYIIDTTLRQVNERAMVLQRFLSIPPGSSYEGEATQEEPLLSRSVEHLRASLLGQKLRWIAEYVEGYPAAVQPERRKQWAWEQKPMTTGGIRREVYLVCAVVYGSAHGGKTWSYPKHCQHTDLGKLLHAALLQFYREYLPSEQLISVAMAAKEIGIARQTLHEWMANGSVHWIYEAERDVIWLDRDEVSHLSD